MQQARLKSCVALLRGINVGGKNKLPMRELAALFEELGCSAVRTYIQSGNVVCAAPARVVEGLPEAAPRLIAERFGLQVPVLVRSASEMSAVASGNPFLRAGAPPESLHVVFLRDAAQEAQLARLEPDRSPPDTFIAGPREIFLCCPDGLGRTKLTNAWFDSRLDTVSTMRNWRTVLELDALANQ